MPKYYLKLFLSIVFSVVGIILCLFAGYLPLMSPNALATLIIVGCCFIVLGAIQYTHYVKASRIIHGLYNKAVPIFAHWTYQLDDVPEQKRGLEETYHTDLSLTLLGSALCIMLGLGFYLADSYPGIFILWFSIGATLFTALVSFYWLQKDYLAKCNKPLEVIISDEVIFFGGELYGLQKNFYTLSSIKVNPYASPYIQFIYGYETTDLGPAYILTIPIPSNELAAALRIKEHYMEQIKGEND